MIYLPLPGPNGGCCSKANSFANIIGHASIRQSIASPSGISTLLRTVFGASIIGVSPTRGGGGHKESSDWWPSSTDPSPGSTHDPSYPSLPSYQSSSGPCPEPRYISINYSYKIGTRTPAACVTEESGVTAFDEDYIEVVGTMYIGSTHPEPSVQATRHVITGRTCGSWRINSVTSKWTLGLHSGQRGWIGYTDAYGYWVFKGSGTAIEAADICDCAENSACEPFHWEEDPTSVPVTLWSDTDTYGCKWHVVLFRDGTKKKLIGTSSIVTHTSLTDLGGCIETEDYTVRAALVGSTGGTDTTTSASVPAGGPSIGGGFVGVAESDECMFQIMASMPASSPWQPAESGMAIGNCSDTLTLSKDWSYIERNGQGEGCSGTVIHFCEVNITNAHVVCGSTDSSGDDTPIDTPSNGDNPIYELPDGNGEGAET